MEGGVAVGFSSMTGRAGRFSALSDGGWMGGGRPKGGHALAILPGLIHYTIFGSPLLAAVTLAFLDG